MSINNLKKFHQYVGETIMLCQCIEFDIKWMYAAMLRGDVDDNFEDLQKEKISLGQAILKLEALDNSEDPYLTSTDYKMLREINDIRIHWAHNAYLEFIYCDDEGEREELFLRQSRRLENDHNRLNKLSDKIEKTRLEVLDTYGRI